VAEKKPETDLREYAGGWMTERKGTDLPPFLKFALPVIALCCMAYLFIFMNGEVGHSTRGRLVQQLNAATHSSSVFMYLVAALIAVYLIVLVRAVIAKPEHED
jgi:hypothetical protein